MLHLRITQKTNTQGISRKNIFRLGSFCIVAAHVLVGCSSAPKPPTATEATPTEANDPNTPLPGLAVIRESDAKDPLKEEPQVLVPPLKPGVQAAKPEAPTPAPALPSPPSVPLDPTAPARMADTKVETRNDTAIDGLEALQINSALGRVESTCSTNKKKNGRFVLVMKQWHPAPSVNTVPSAPGRERELNKKIPQAENQIASYRMLESWISDGQLRTVLVEGCQRGHIARGFETRFNGWNLRALEKRAGEPDYTSVITHLGLKLKAKLGPVVDVFCADDEDLLKAHGLAFSDGRGIAGFLSRIEGAKEDDPKARSYLASIIDLYKMPPTTTIAEATVRLKTELKDVVSRIQQGFEARNRRMVKKVMDAPARPMALIVGGAHAADLKTKLEKEGVACAVIEPKGYRAEDDELLSRLQKMQ